MFIIDHKMLVFAILLIIVFFWWMAVRRCCRSYVIRFILDINQGTIPTKITIKSHKFPVVMSYALIISQKVSPIANPIIVSNRIVRKNHNPPMSKYVFFVPFPSLGMKSAKQWKLINKELFRWWVMHISFQSGEQSQSLVTLHLKLRAE